MAVYPVFTDESNEYEMECYLNKQGQVSIRFGEADDDKSSRPYIMLTKSDISQLIETLTELEEQMED